MNCFDSTMTEVENNKFFKKYYGLIKHFNDTTELNFNELSCLLLIYHKCVLLNNGKSKQMTKPQLQELFGTLLNMNDVDLTTKIINVVSANTKTVSPSSFVLLFRVYMTNDLRVRMKFAFDIYDYNSQGYLTSEQVDYAVEKFFRGPDEDLLNELKADMVEMLFHKFDLDKDGLIDYFEYSTVVREQPELLECFGAIFPDRKQMDVIAHSLNLESCLGFISTDGLKIEKDIDAKHENHEVAKVQPKVVDGNRTRTRSSVTINDGSPEERWFSKPRHVI